MNIEFKEQRYNCDDCSRETAYFKLGFGKNDFGVLLCESCFKAAIKLLLINTTISYPNEGLSCGCKPGSHPNHQNYLQGGAERDGTVCKLGWHNP